MRLILTAAVLAAAGCAAAPAAPEPEGLFALAPASERAALASARRHVLVVRHAKKPADCSDLQCALTPEGAAEAARLAALLEGVRVSARASAACRAAATAATGAGATPVVHRAADRLSEGCAAMGLEPGERTRAQAIAAVKDDGARWTLVGEHSNTVCVWVAAFTEDVGEKCAAGELEISDYGDIFWLYQAPSGTWRRVTLVDAFGADGPG